MINFYYKNTFGEDMEVIIYNGNNDDILKLIKHMMIETDTRQKDIVEFTGLNKGTVSNFLTGKSSNPTLDTLKMYCDAMSCDLIIDIKKRDEKWF